MGLVRALKAVYLGEYGYRTEGETFEYMGPDNPNLESAEKQPYSELSLDELKDEATLRKLRITPQTTADNLRLQLVADDEKKA